MTKRATKTFVSPWTIVKENDTRYLIVDDGMTKGEVIFKTNGTSMVKMWEVNLMMVPDLTFRAHEIERCWGFVRGVEATVNLYAKETGRDRRSA